MESRDWMLTEIIKVLQHGDRIVIGVHTKPDADSIGSMLAIARALELYGHKHVVCGIEELPNSFKFLPGTDKLMHWSDLEPDLSPEIFIALDCGSQSRLGHGERVFKRAKITINIDHHMSNELFGDINFVDVNAAACGEQVYEVLLRLNYPIDTEIVACLYAAIASDTGSFRFTNTTAASHRIAAELHEQGFDFPEMSQRLFDTRTPQEMQLLAAILSTFELYAEGQISVMTVTMDMLSRMQTDESETENYAGYARSITGSRVAILFKEQKDVVRVSFRSRDLTDVHALAALFGGGGHKKASGAVLMGNLHDVKAAVLAKTEAFLRG